MRTSSRAAVVAAVTALALPLLGALPSPSGSSGTATAAETAAREITYRQWDTQAELASGRFAGTKAVRGRLVLAGPIGTRSYDDPHGYRTKRYSYGQWLSRWQRPGHAFDELIPSWDAATPRDSWVQVQVRVRTTSGRRSRWYTMANWASGDRQFHRTSLGRQTDAVGEVHVDTLAARPAARFGSWQMRITLNRRAGTRANPRLESMGAVASLLPTATTVATSRPGVASGRAPVTLPGYSQMIHDGHYPQYDAGGEAWCSPTSVSMVLGGLGRLPSAQEYSWVPAGHPDPWVDHAARSQYDYGYDGAGNWSFSAAYAASHADTAFVTRLRSLREAERFIAVGIPLVASVKFGRGQLTGAPISSTSGHLLVIVGFTATGDVVVNDPAAPDDRTVVRTYKRSEFENAWIPRSGGLVYVIRNHDQPLPATRTRNW